MKMNSLNILCLGTDVFLKNRHHFSFWSLLSIFFDSINQSNTKKNFFFHLKLKRMINTYNSREKYKNVSMLKIYKIMQTRELVE